MKLKNLRPSEHYERGPCGLVDIKGQQALGCGKIDEHRLYIYDLAPTTHSSVALCWSCAVDQGITQFWTGNLREGGQHFYRALVVEFSVEVAWVLRKQTMRPFNGGYELAVYTSNRRPGVNLGKRQKERAAELRRRYQPQFLDRLAVAGWRVETYAWAGSEVDVYIAPGA